MLMLLLLPPMITTIIITAPPFSALSLAVIYDHRHLTCDNIFYVYSMRETWVRSLGWEDTLEKGTATHSIILAKFHGILENSMVRGDWWATVHGVARSQTRLGSFHLNHFTIELIFASFPQTKVVQSAYQEL